MASQDQPRDPWTGQFRPRWWRRPPGGPSLWERFRTWLFGAPEPTLEPETLDGWMPDEHGDPATARLAIPDTLFEFNTPTRDDAFTFAVQVRIVWNATVTDSDDDRRVEMQRSIDRFVAARQAVIRSEVMSVVRPLGRALPPYRADRLEERINQEHSRIHFVMPKRPDPPVHGPRARPGRDRAVVDAPYDLVDAQLYAWADLCEEIRAVQQQSWLDLTRKAGRHTARVQDVLDLAELRERWRELLVHAMERMGRLSEDRAAWLTVEALRLAADQQLSGQLGTPPKLDPADVLALAVRQRAGEAERLTRQIADMIQTADREDAALFEFAFASDTALREVLLLLGVPVQDIDDTQRDGRLGR